MQPDQISGRAPILLYRARLGFVFGRRLLMLEHRGRKTGAKRYVVLEVIDNPAPDQYVVGSGFGFLVAAERPA